MYKRLLQIIILVGLLIVYPVSAAISIPQCIDGIDNDGDTLIDFPSDPGCDGPFDADEFNEPSIPAEPDPVIILPGLLGSWNFDLMISPILSDNWVFPPGNKSYFNLVDALLNVGYSTSTDLFIGFYDWRQPNSDSASEYLIPIIDEALSKSGKDKVDIVAHSMGGLVARSYIESTDYRDDVDQLVMLGTPNKGSGDAYLLWEGAKMSKDWNWFAKQIFTIFVSAKIFAGTETPPLRNAVDVVQAKIPSIKDLLPVYDYIFDSQTGNPTGYQFLSIVNQFLETLNAGINALNSRVEVTVISGDDISTIGQIPVEPQSFIDSLFNRWVDGKPDPNPPAKDSTSGDNRVLLTSSEITGAAHIILSGSKHDRLPTLAQQEVVEVLTGQQPLAFFDTPDSESGLSFLVASPVDLEITDPLGRIISKFDNDIPDAGFFAETDSSGAKMAIIPDPVDGEYQVKLTGTDTGEFHFFSSFADTATTTLDVKEGVVVQAQELNYNVNLDSEDPLSLLDAKVEVTIDDLLNYLDEYRAAGLIKRAGTYYQLRAKLLVLQNLIKTRYKLIKRLGRAPWLNKAITKQIKGFIKILERGRGIDSVAADFLKKLMLELSV